MTPLFVIPAKAGIHYFRYLQVPGFPLSRELQLFTKPSKLNNVTENTIKYCVNTLLSESTEIFQQLQSRILTFFRMKLNSP